MKRAIQATLLTFSVAVATASAQLAIDISGARRAPQPIAVLPVDNDPGVRIDYIISSDLYKTGMFQPIAPNRIRVRPKSPTEVDYGEFTRLGVNYLLMGRVFGDSARQGAQFVLDQVNSEQTLFNQRILAANARQLSHQAADLVLERLTGTRGAFATQIAYVSEQRSGSTRRYRLIVSDVDGANRREVFSSSLPILSPAWSPGGKQLAYMTYSHHHAQIVVQSVDGGARRVVTQSQGTISSPSWSPDGRQIALARADDGGNMDIYLLDLASGAERRLTTHGGIDTEANFSPDGRYLYFTSDRAGNPQIYRMNRDGGGITRAVIGGNYSSNSELSPDGRTMVLTRQSGGGYQIGLYDLTTRHFRALTGGRLDEGATFAPDGRLIMYTAMDNGRSVIRMINLKGKVTQTLSDPSGQLRDPAWGPDVRH